MAPPEVLIALGFLSVVFIGLCVAFAAAYSRQITVRFFVYVMTAVCLTIAVAKDPIWLVLAFPLSLILFVELVLRPFPRKPSRMPLFDYELNDPGPRREFRFSDWTEEEVEEEQGEQQEEEDERFPLWLQVAFLAIFLLAVAAGTLLWNEESWTRIFRE